MKTHSGLYVFASRLRKIITAFDSGHVNPTDLASHWDKFALDLFVLQFEHNHAYRRFCEARRLSPANLEHWTRIPTMPALAFKEYDLTCLPPNGRARVFHSSGTTTHRPSRHFHNSESLAVYEDSLLAWFRIQFGLPSLRYRIAILTPQPADAPHSSLVHMFSELQRRTKFDAAFFGRILPDGGWDLDIPAVLGFLGDRIKSCQPVMLCGTAFGFVHLLDHLQEHNLKLSLPFGSCAMETGGYKGRSRVMPKKDLHSLITSRLDIPSSQIVSEYGMSELSSQAYDNALGGRAEDFKTKATRIFRFPPWARARIVSPETGREVAEGETGLIQVFDLANVFSVMAIQTEDLGVRSQRGFELIGRAEQSEPRGCSLMANA